MVLTFHSCHDSTSAEGEASLTTAQEIVFGMGSEVRLIIMQRY